MGYGMLIAFILLKGHDCFAHIFKPDADDTIFVWIKNVSWAVRAASIYKEYVLLMKCL